MGLATEVRNSARALEGAAFALAHILKHPISTLAAADGLPDGSGGTEARQPNNEERQASIEVRQECEAVCLTVRLVVETAEPVLNLLEDDSPVVRGELDKDSRGIYNGFGSLASILVTLLNYSTSAVLITSGIQSRGLTGVNVGTALGRVKTHHGQLRALYGILHLATKIVNNGDITQTLFVNFPDDDDPRKWRSAINMDDFYGRWFGFHYSAHMKNVLRIVNIVRESVGTAISTTTTETTTNRSNNSSDNTNNNNTNNNPPSNNNNRSALAKNVAVLGWGWVYTNMVLMNTFGVNIEGARNIGNDNSSDLPSIEAVRTFMNLVEDPIIAGVANLAAADAAIDKAFQIPSPKSYRDAKEVRRAFENRIHARHSDDDEYMDMDIEQNYNWKEIHTVWKSITTPVEARLLSAKKRPVSLQALLPFPHTSSNAQRNGGGARPGEVRTVSSITPDRDDKRDSLLGRRETDGFNGNGNSNSNSNRNSLESPPVTPVAKHRSTGALPPAQPAPKRSPLESVAESSYLANALKSEFSKLSTGVSSFLGLQVPDRAKALIMHFHGGGFVSQSSLGHSVYLKTWGADMPDTVILSVDYKLSPEYQFPVALHECVYAYCWAVHNAKYLGTKAEKVILVGDSAGGNFALAVALMLRKLGMREPDGVCLAYPSLYLSMAWSPSRLLSFFDPLLPLSVLELCMTSYLDENYRKEAHCNPYISPVVASREQLRELPRIVTITGSLDPLLDDTALLAHRLKDIKKRREKKKNDVIRIYEAMPHGFLNMIQFSEQARAASGFLAKHMAIMLDITYGKNQVSAMEEERRRRRSNER